MLFLKNILKWSDVIQNIKSDSLVFIYHSKCDHSNNLLNRIKHIDDIVYLNIWANQDFDLNVQNIGKLVYVPIFILILNNTVIQHTHNFEDMKNLYSQIPDRVF